MPVVLSTYLIVWLDRKLKFPLPFPRDIASLTKAEKWCIAVLKKNKVLPAEAIVKNYKVTVLNPDMIFRSNAGVIEIDYSHLGENKTLNCFAKFAPTAGTVWNRVIFNLQLNHIKETWFNRYFVSVDKNIAAPEVYYTEMSFLTGNLCLITEYMANCVHYLDCAYDNFPDNHLQLAIKGLASFHANYWNDTSERMKRVFAIENNTVYFFDSFVANSWSINARNVMVKSWCYVNQNQTVLHGDARVGNMMFPKEEDKGRFVFIDWQAVRKGKAVYDLAYFLNLSLTIEHRGRVEEKSIDTYYRHLVTSGVKSYTREELEQDYRHACLCVLVLLSLPMLSGEASAEGEGTKIFTWGMNIWRERMEAKFTGFDYIWMADRYGLTEQQGRDVVKEMLGVIDSRLKRIQATTSLN